MKIRIVLVVALLFTYSGSVSAMDLEGLKDEMDIHLARARETQNISRTDPESDPESSVDFETTEGLVIKLEAMVKEDEKIRRKLVAMGNLKVKDGQPTSDLLDIVEQEVVRKPLIKILGLDSLCKDPVAELIEKLNTSGNQHNKEIKKHEPLWGREVLKLTTAAGAGALCMYMLIKENN